MLNEIVIGKYYDTNSLIHRMNSFIKILSTIIFVIIMFLSFDYRINLLIFVFMALFILISNIPIRLYLKNVFSMRWFLLFIFLINFIVYKDRYISFILCFRIVGTLLYTMMLLYTTKQDDLVSGLQILFKPLSIFKVPVNKMAHSIVLALTFIPVFLEQYNKVIKSQINKGVYYKNLSVKNRLEVLGCIIVSIFTLGIKKSDTLSDSMEIRLFDFNKCDKFSFKINYFDVLVILIHIALLILTFKEGVFI